MKALASLACALLIATPAFADKPTKESVDHLLKAADTEKSLANMQKQIDTQMRNAMANVLKQQKAGVDTKEFTDAFGKKMTTMLKDELGWAKMSDLYLKVYTDTFSQEEIDGLIAFYESPVGHAFVEKMPMITQKSAVLMQQRMTPLIQHLQQAMQETIQELQKKKGYADGGLPPCTSEQSTPRVAGNSSSSSKGIRATVRQRFFEDENENEDEDD